MVGSTRAQRQALNWGGEVRQARLQQGWSVQRAAEHAGVSWATWQSIEAGQPRARIDTLCAVGEAVGLDLVLKAYIGRQPSLRDSGQLELAAWLCGEAHTSYRASLEVIVGPHGEAIDLVLFGPLEILAIEIERLALDFQAQYRRAQHKCQLLADQHQRPVRQLLAIEDTRRNRAAVEPHRSLFESALPAQSREVLRAIRTGSPLGSDGLIWVRRPGPAALETLRLAV